VSEVYRVTENVALLACFMQFVRSAFVFVFMQYIIKQLLMHCRVYLNSGFHDCCRLQTASSSVNDRDAKDSRLEHAAISSHSSQSDAKRHMERNVRDRPSEHAQRSHQVLDRDDSRRDGSHRSSESELQQRQERRHSGSHHHHHHHHHQQHGSAKDDAVRHNRHTGRLCIVNDYYLLCISQNLK